MLISKTDTTDIAESSKLEFSKKIVDTKIDFSLYSQAIKILRKTRLKYGCRMIDEVFGAPINKDKATVLFNNWLKRNKYSISSKYDTIPELEFSEDLLCSAKLCTIGPKRYINKPEKRKYKLQIRLASQDNLFLRENSFESLLDHELGTHLCRMVNEGLQPWYYDRSKFNLSTDKTRRMLEIEEGLAAIHTTLKLGMHELFVPAILYVAGCIYGKIAIIT